MHILSNKLGQKYLWILVAIRCDLYYIFICHTNQYQFSKSLKPRFKFKIFKSSVIPVLLYEAETWELTHKEEEKLNFNMKG